MQHLGTFEGERHASSRGYRAKGTLAEDLAGLMATIAVSLAVAFIAFATLASELPA